MHLFLYLSATAAALLPAAAAAQAANVTDPAATPSSDIIVTGQAQLNQSASATGLDLTLRETPQSVTVVDRQRIEDFALNNVNDLLDQVVGVQVDRNETDRTNYYARGFQITNQQVDGIGLPLLNAIDGDIDTILYERVDVTRGANAIQNGVGNPSATINYLRKRPTKDLHVDAAAYVGSFDTWRVEGDMSVPLTRDGTVRVRAIGAHEERDSWLDYNKVNRDVFAGLVAWDVTPAITATAGYSRQSNKADGILWGALPLVFSDGTRIPYPRSASTAAPWTYVDTVNESAFGELAWRPGGDWSLRGVFTYNDQAVNARRLYASGTPDPVDGTGVTGSSGLYPTRNRQYLLDGYASGSVTVFGRPQQLAFGISTGRLREQEYEGDSLVESFDYGDIRSLATFYPPLPDYAPITRRVQERDRLTRVYGAIHLNVTDRLKGVAGASAFWLKTTGASYGADLYRKNQKVSPYAGLLYDLTDSLTVYASYTDIYQPQSQLDVNLRRLDPAQGTSIEAGIKGSWLDDRLYATAAVFRAKQRDLATYVCTFNTDGCADGPNGLDYYEGVDTIVKGIEAEVSARVADHWSVNGGITHLHVPRVDGDPVIRFYPRDSIKFGATYQVPEWRDLKLGAQFRYQSRISADDDSASLPIEQGSYAVLDLLGEVRLADRVKASVNVRNVTNRKYLNSLEWGQAYYAAPRSVLGTVRFEL